MIGRCIDIKFTYKWLLGTILFVSLAVLSFFLFSNPKKEESEELNYEKNVVKYAGKIERPVNFSPNNISFPGFAPIKIKEGAKELFIDLVNPEFNEADIQFIVMLNEEDVLLNSGLVAPGEAITRVPLPKKLKKGAYTLSVEMKGFARDKNHTRVTGTNNKISLEVM